MSSDSSSSHGDITGSSGSHDLERDENLGQGKDLLSVGEDVLVANALSGLEEIVDGKMGMAVEASMFKDWFEGRKLDKLTRTTDDDVRLLENLRTRFQGRKYHAVWVDTIRRVWENESATEFNASTFANLVAVLALGSKTFQRITQQSPGGTVEHLKDIVAEFQLWFKVVYKALDPPLRNPNYISDLGEVSESEVSLMSFDKEEVVIEEVLPPVIGESSKNPVINDAGSVVGSKVPRKTLERPLEEWRRMEEEGQETSEVWPDDPLDFLGEGGPGKFGLSFPKKLAGNSGSSSGKMKVDAFFLDPMKLFAPEEEGGGASEPKVGKPREVRVPEKNFLSAAGKSLSSHQEVWPPLPGPAVKDKKKEKVVGCCGQRDYSWTMWGLDPHWGRTVT